MIRTLAAAAFLFALSTPIAAAAPPQDSEKPTQAQDTASSTSSSSTSTTKQKPKKVWTNDNVPNSGEGVSVVGSSNTGKVSTKTQLKGSPAARGSVDPRVVANLRDQLHRLEAQLAVVDKQYADLKAQSKGDSRKAGGLQQNTFAYDSSSVEEQLQHLQDKKKRIQSTIDELLDAARKAGIEPGDLR